MVCLTQEISSQVQSGFIQVQVVAHLLLSFSSNYICFWMKHEIREHVCPKKGAELRLGTLKIFMPYV